VDLSCSFVGGDDVGAAPLFLVEHSLLFHVGEEVGDSLFVLFVGRIQALVYLIGGEAIGVLTDEVQQLGSSLSALASGRAWRSRRTRLGNRLATQHRFIGLCRFPSSVKALKLFVDLPALREKVLPFFLYFLALTLDVDGERLLLCRWLPPVSGCLFV
jgi:hypothetical protein